MPTNFHFTSTDLQLESTVPATVGIFVVLACGLEISFMEGTVIGIHLVWYLVGSHSGKHMPTVSYYPPLSFLYNSMLSFDVDERNVYHHERHHMLVHCNYGLMQWCDIVLGTYDGGGAEKLSNMHK
jgi:hypothetical protein